MTRQVFEEMKGYIVTKDNAVLIKKDQPSRVDIVTTNAGEDMFEEMKEYIVKKHNAELSEKDQPSRGNTFTTTAGEDVFTNRVLLKTTSVCCKQLTIQEALQHRIGWGDGEIPKSSR